MKKNRQLQRGFTLLELLVVLVIIAIISTTSVGALRFFGEDTLETFQNDLVSLLELGVDEAILTGKVHGLFRQGDTIYLKKYARANEAADVSGDAGDQTKKQVGALIDGLISLGGSEDPESAEQATESDLGAFADDGDGQWNALDIEPLAVPEDINLTLTVDAGSAIDLAIDKATSAATSEITDDPEVALPQEPAEDLITVFWPSGLVQPGGSAEITNEDSRFEVRWETTSQISVDYAGGT